MISIVAMSREMILYGASPSLSLSSEEQRNDSSSTVFTDRLYVRAQNLRRAGKEQLDLVQTLSNSISLEQQEREQLDLVCRTLGRRVDDLGRDEQAAAAIGHRLAQR